MEVRLGPLNKYKNTKVIKTKLFTAIPKPLIQDENLSIPAKGLYIYLMSNAGIFALSGGRLAYPTMSFKDIAKKLRWREVKKVEELIDELKSNGYIEIKTFQGELYITKTRPKKAEDEKEEDKQFAKIYPMSMKRIVTKLNASRALIELFYYAVFRTAIFENDRENSTFYKPLAYLTSIAQVNEATLRKHLKWLRENNVIAYFKCRQKGYIGYEKYYYADMHDCHKLTKVVEGFVKCKEITEVLE